MSSRHHHRRATAGRAVPVRPGAAAPSASRAPARRNRNEHKSSQLCAQVALAVSDGLAQCMDDLLQSLVVESVLPAPTTSRLLVTVYSFEDGIDPRQILDRLAEVRGILRDEVAAAIHRRRVPELSFRVVEHAQILNL